MITSELIETLQESLIENGDLEVMTSSNYGDYHKTEQLNYIQDIIVCIPAISAYSETGLAVPDDDPDEEDDSARILVLKYK